jgi:hypothetical protein
MEKFGRCVKGVNHQSYLARDFGSKFWLGFPAAKLCEIFIDEINSMVVEPPIECDS